MTTDLAQRVCDDGATFPPPRPFQVNAHQRLRDGFKAGHKNQVIMAPTGAGKTFLGLRICHEAMQKGKRAVFLCDRTTLINQTSAAADQYGLSEHGIIQANHWRRQPEHLLQIASAQTLSARGYWPSADVVVVDECFPAGTLVKTPNGDVSIDTLKAGDAVFNCLGLTQVLSVYNAKSTTLVKVKVSNGVTIECTKDHPIFTDRGWVAAGKLVTGSRVFSAENLQALWEKDCSSAEVENSQRGSSEILSDGKTIFTDSVLLKLLRSEVKETDSDKGALYERGSFPELLGENDKKQSNEVARGQSKVICNAKKNQARAKGQRRKRAGADYCTENAFESIGRSVGGRVHSKNTQDKRAGIPTSLQTRFSQSGADDCNRAGRPESLRLGASSAGCKERLSAEVIRVESVEDAECPVGKDVYNLRIAGHPSYFANGVLVHNCHTQLKVWTTFAMESKAACIGLSATPFSVGLGKIFTNLINATTMHDLTESGVLVPMRIFSCTKSDMRGAATAGGEWTDKAAEERGMDIVGDVVSEWMKFGEGRKTIIFGATIKHCEELARQFVDAGIMAAVFTSDTTAAERLILLTEYRKHDSVLKVLISVEALAKGFDVPDVGCICDARPLRKSLSTAIQMWGRGLRSSPDTGKKDCLLLDFSGNIIRFGEDYSEIFFNGLDALDAGDKLDKKIREEDKEESHGCPKCGYKPFHKRCMGCGYEKPSIPLQVAEAGVMREIVIGSGKNAKKLADNGEHLWNQLTSYARIYSQPAAQQWRATCLYKAITKTDPIWKFSTAPTVEIGRNVTNKITSLNMAYKKGMAKR